MDVGIGEAGIAQRPEIVLFHGRRSARQPDRVVDDGAEAGFERGLLRVADQCLDEFRIPRQPEETPPVVLDSIVALVDCRDRNRDPFPLREADPGPAAHEVLVEREVVFERPRIQAAGAQDVVHSAIRTAMGAVEAGEGLLAGFRVFGGDQSDPGHESQRAYRSPLRLTA